MKNKMMLLTIVLSLGLVSFNACSIEGEEVCGIWNAQSDYGDMQVEITPWKGKFLGYLLAYKNGNEIIKGAKTEENIFITDLALKGGKYQKGKIYLNPNSETTCGLTLELLNKNQVKAVYDCDGQTSEEFWYRKGHFIPEKPIQTTNKAKVETPTIELANPTQEVMPRSVNTEEKKVERVVDKKPQNATPPTTNITKTSAPTIEGETKKQSTFYIVGVQEVVKYDNFNAIEKAIETLWTKAYNDDFSSKLKNIIDQNSMYVGYSSYENTKGKMVITLGYEVKNLSNIPSGLKGVKIPSNEYLVYPMSGNKSDFEGDGWNQLGELMMYRKADSADFEVYTFNSSYNVKKAEMWIATK